MWFVCFVWTMAFCLTNAYPASVDPETFSTIFGIPAWVALGIGLPWLIANVVTIWFCMTQMEDADLDEQPSPTADVADSDGASENGGAANV